MKFLNRWYSLFFIISGKVFCSVPAMPMTFVDNPPAEKKLHNAISSSVKNSGSVSIPNNIVHSSVQSDSKIDNNYLAKVASSNAVSKKVVQPVIDEEPQEEAAPEETDDHESAMTQANEEMQHTTEMLKDGKAVPSPEQESDILQIEDEPGIVQSEPGVLYQEPGFIDETESVAFNFEDADLANVASYMETIHHIKFVTEDIVSTAKDAKGLAGHKLTFKTNKILTKKESWDLFITFLHMAGLDIIPMMQAGFYKIVPLAKANGEAIPTYIGVDVDTLPDNDMLVRFVYFALNIDPAKVQQILAKMQSGSAKLDVFSELRAFIFLDRSTNIKALMQIVKELDQSVMPESLSVIKIKRANVDDVKTLYELLKPKSSSGQQPPKVWAPGRREPSLEYFPQDVSLFTDKRTNSLILLGAAKSIKRIEEFVEKFIDADITRDSPPIFTYQLEYTNAADLQTILSSVVQYGSGTPGGGTAQEYGGVRNGIKYFSKMSILAEPHSNSLIINSTKEDYEALVPLIKELDVPQKQIGLEVLIVQVTDQMAKTMGAQISGPGGPDAPITANKGAQTFAQNISAQTSGILGFGNAASFASTPSTPSGSSSAPVVTTATDTAGDTFYSIKSSLAGLLGSSLNGIVNEGGAILVTFGKPIWALFKVLQSFVSAHVVANPFVVVSNNTQAVVNIGQQRRIISSQVVSSLGTTTSGTTPQNATLGFTITPQINKSNIINLAINVQNQQFLDQSNQTSALMDQKSITTYASVANGEVLVLGGIMQEQYNSTSRGVPFLEHIPLFGWFFKSKSKSVIKSHFLVFICPRVLDSPNQKEAGVDTYTRYKMLEAQKEMDIMEDLDWFASKRDPIQKAFFGDSMPKTLQQFAGQSNSPKLKRKKLQERNVRIQGSSKNGSQKQLSPKPASSKQKKGAPAANGHISFEQDFLKMPAKAPGEVKNSISKSAQPGGVYV